MAALIPKPATTAAQFLAGARYRRSVYALKKASPVPDARIREVVEEVLAFSPSSYNTRPVRATLVLGDQQKAFWDIVAAQAEPVLRAAGDAVWEGMKPRIEGFKNAYGSVRPPPPRRRRLPLPKSKLTRFVILRSCSGRATRSSRSR